MKFSVIFCRSTPVLTAHSGSENVTVQCNVGDYFLVAHSVYNSSAQAVITGAEEIIRSRQTYGSTSATLIVVQATSTEVRISRNSSGAISVVQMTF